MQRGCWCSHTTVASNRLQRLPAEATTEICALKSVWEHDGARHVISIPSLGFDRLHRARFRSPSIPLSQIPLVCLVFHQASFMYPRPPLTSLYFLYGPSVFPVEEFTRKINKLMHDTRPVHPCWNNHLTCVQAQVLRVTQCGPMFLHLHCEQKLLCCILI